MHRIDKINNVSWTQSFVENNITKIESNWSFFPKRTIWNCNCHVVFDSDNDPLIKKIDFNFLRSEYIKLISNYCKNFNENLDKIGNIWYNYYKFDQYQEPHNHISPEHIGPTNKEFVGVHYLIFNPKIHSNLMFVDESLEVPEIKAGDILIFSGEEYHYVKESKTNSPRLTISFGFNLK